MQQEPFTLPDEVTVISIITNGVEIATIAVPRTPHAAIYDHDGDAWATDARTTDPDWLGVACRENMAKHRTAAEPPAAPTPERALLDGIDWHLLRDQKLALLRIIDDAATWAEDEEDGPLLGGLVHLIDAVQDTADGLGLVPADAWLTEK